MTTEEARLAPLTEMQIDLLDHALAEDGCHGFYADHVHTNRAVMQIVAQAKAEALAVVKRACDIECKSPGKHTGCSSHEPYRALRDSRFRSAAPSEGSES